MSIRLLIPCLLLFQLPDEGVNFNKKILEIDFKDKVLNFISSINQFPAESFDKENFSNLYTLQMILYQTLLNPFIQPDDYSKLFIIPDNI